MLESYVTPLLMSYVNRYIKNLKPSDLQLSLWGGDVVLSKLDLKLDVLEQELKLPFTFLSGHIHELRIHVPWTKLSSEPVVITINTMECILKLKDGAQCEMVYQWFEGPQQSAWLPGFKQQQQSVLSLIDSHRTARVHTMLASATGLRPGPGPGLGPGLAPAPWPWPRSCFSTLALTLVSPKGPGPGPVLAPAPWPWPRSCPITLALALALVIAPARCPWPRSCPSTLALAPVLARGPGPAPWMRTRAVLPVGVCQKRACPDLGECSRAPPTLTYPQDDARARARGLVPQQGVFNGTSEIRTPFVELCAGGGVQNSAGMAFSAVVQRGRFGAHEPPCFSLQRANRRPMRRRQMSYCDALYGYVQSLIRRVINNVNIVVNNLILKYVEDDIVLSVNITSAECYTVDELWDRAFMDIATPELVLRKVINFADCTVCLDKRNASGKIEFYQDPLLYKCSFTTRLHFTYHNINSKIPAVIKIQTMVESLKLSLTDQQLPMFMRVLELAVALYYGEIGAHRDREKEETASTTEAALSIPGGAGERVDPATPTPYPSPDQYMQMEDEEQGWVSWAWSFVPALVGTGEDEVEEGLFTAKAEDGPPSPTQLSFREPIVAVGFYCTKAIVTFKLTFSLSLSLPLAITPPPQLTEGSSESSYYSPQKVKSREVLCVEQEGITVEALMLGETFFDCQIGVVGCRALCLKSIMGVRDFEESMGRMEEDAVFFHCGESLSAKGMTYLTNSLFDYRSPENNGVRAEFILDGNLHKETYSEAAGLQRFGAFYLDYLYTMENASGKVLQDVSAVAKQEPALLVQETSVKRLAIGPLHLQLHSSAVHRILKMAACAMDHEYEPYCKAKPDVVEECRTPPGQDEVAVLEEFIPTRLTSVTLLKASVTVAMAEFNRLHILLPAILGQKVLPRHSNPRTPATRHAGPEVAPLTRVRSLCQGSAAQASALLLQPSRPLPALRLQVERVNLEHSVPMYGPELTRTVSSLSQPSDNLLHHCYTHCYLKVFELQAGLTLLDSERASPLLPIIPSFSAAVYGKMLNLPAYWLKRPSVSVAECMFELPHFTVQATHAQMLLLKCLWQSWTYSTGSGAGPSASEALISEVYRTPGRPTRNSLLLPASVVYWLIHFRFLRAGGKSVAPTVEVSVHSVELKVSQRVTVWCSSGTLGAVKVAARTVGGGEGQKEQLVVLLQAPSDTREFYSRQWLGESHRPQSLLTPDLLTFSLQVPQPAGDCRNSSAVLLLSVQGIAVNVDPVLSTWLLHQSQRPSGSRQTQQAAGGVPMVVMKRREDEASVGSTPLAKQLSNQASDYASSPVKTKTITALRVPLPTVPLYASRLLRFLLSRSTRPVSSASCCPALRVPLPTVPLYTSRLLRLLLSRSTRPASYCPALRVPSLPLPTVPLSASRLLRFLLSRSTRPVSSASFCPAPRVPSPPPPAAPLHASRLLCLLLPRSTCPVSSASFCPAPRVPSPPPPSAPLHASRLLRLLLPRSTRPVSSASFCPAPRVLSPPPPAAPLLASRLLRLLLPRSTRPVSSASCYPAPRVQSPPPPAAPLLASRLLRLLLPRSLRPVSSASCCPAPRVPSPPPPAAPLYASLLQSRPLSIPVKVMRSSAEHMMSSEERMKELMASVWDAVKRLTLQVELQSCCVFVPKHTLPCPSTIACGDIPGTVRSWYHSQASMPGTLVVCLPQVSVLSAGHRHMEPLQEIPFTVPKPVLEEGDAFPWTVTVGQFSVYTLLGHQRSLSLLEPTGCTSTLAVTSHKLQPGPVPGPASPESRHAFIVCLHVDLQPLHLKLSNPQVQLLYELFASWSSIWEHLQRRGILPQAPGFPDPHPPPAGPPSPVHSSAGTVPPDTSTLSPSADLGSPTEVLLLLPCTCSCWYPSGPAAVTLHMFLFVSLRSCRCYPAHVPVRIPQVLPLLPCTCSCWYPSGPAAVTLHMFLFADSTPLGEDPAFCEAVTLEQRTSSIGGASGKVSVWMQWMLPRFTLKVFSPDPSTRTGTPVQGRLSAPGPTAKCPAAPAGAVRRPGEGWQAGFDGVILQCKDKALTAAKALEVCHQPHGFLSVTYTQAVTRNVRHKLTARQEGGAGPQKLSEGGADGSPQHLHEILLTAQPFDLVLSCPLLANVAQVFHTVPPPPCRRPVRERRSAGQPMRGHAFCSSSLPLIYVNTSVIRVFCPLQEAHCDSDSQLKEKQEDTLVLKIGSVSMAPQADNPLTRTVLRKDIYQVCGRRRVKVYRWASVRTPLHRTDPLLWASDPYTIWPDLGLRERSTASKWGVCSTSPSVSLTRPRAARSSTRSSARSSTRKAAKLSPPQKAGDTLSVRSANPPPPPSAGSQRLPVKCSARKQPAFLRSDRVSEEIEPEQLAGSNWVSLPIPARSGWCPGVRTCGIANRFSLSEVPPSHIATSHMRAISASGTKRRKPLRGAARALNSVGCDVHRRERNSGLLPAVSCSRAVEGGHASGCAPWPPLAGSLLGCHRSFRQVWSHHTKKRWIGRGDVTTVWPSVDLIGLRALNLGVLRDPGSDVEDRQYQIDLQSINMGTAQWEQLRPEGDGASGATPADGGRSSQNPALEWNMASRYDLAVSLQHMTSGYDLAVSLQHMTSGYDLAASLQHMTSGYDLAASLQHMTSGYDLGASLQHMTSGYDLAASLQHMTSGYDLAASLQHMTSGYDLAASLQHMTSGYDLAASLQHMTSGYDLAASLQHMTSGYDLAASLQHMTSGYDLPVSLQHMTSGIRRHQERRAILTPILTDFSIRITVAPAIIYSKPVSPDNSPAEEIVVCGHSLEVNVTSGLDMFLSVSQVQLLQQLLQANVGPADTSDKATEMHKQSPKCGSVRTAGRTEPQGAGRSPCGQDSGFGSDSARLRIVQIDQQSGTSHHRLARPSRQPTITKNLSFIPFDVFLTAGRLALMTYAVTRAPKSHPEPPEPSRKSAPDTAEEEARDAPPDAPDRPPAPTPDLSALTAEDLLNANSCVRTPATPARAGLLALEGLSSPCRASARQALGITVVRQPGRRGPGGGLLQPLLFLQLAQPSALISCHQRRQRLDLSLFDLTLKGVTSDYICLDSGKSLPESLDYSVFWLQTVAGEADSRTGIPPPLLSLCIRDFLNGPAELKAALCRPLKVNPTLAKVEQAKSFWRKIFPESGHVPGSSPWSPQYSPGKTSPPPHGAKQNGGTAASPPIPARLADGLQSLAPFHKISLQAVEMVVVLEIESHPARPSLTLSASGVKGSLSTKSGQKPLENVREACVLLHCEDVLVRTGLKGRSTVFAGPFSCCADLEARWCRHSGSPASDAGPPRILLDLKGGLLQVFWGQEHYNCIALIQEYLRTCAREVGVAEEEPEEMAFLSQPPPSPGSRSLCSERSSDDLRTGLFQYIQDSASQKLPGAHEVVFYNETEDSPGVMMWRYPEPRVLTFVRITPVPFNTTEDPDISTADLGDVLQVPCSLEFWDELKRAFVPYREFSLSESSVCELTLPPLSPHTLQTDLVASDLWRVVVNSTGEGADESSDSESGSQLPCEQLVSPTALAACTRVDSSFAPWFVPSVGVSLRLAYLELRLCHHLDQLGTGNACTPDTLHWAQVASTSPDTPHWAQVASTSPDSPHWAQVASTSPDSPHWAQVASTSPDTPHRAQVASTSPDSPHWAQVASTSPDTPHRAQVASTSPDTPHWAQVASTSPDSPHGAQAASTSPDSPHGAQAASTSPDSPHGAQVASTSPDSPHWAQAASASRLPSRGTGSVHIPRLPSRGTGSVHIPRLPSRGTGSVHIPRLPSRGTGSVHIPRLPSRGTGSVHIPRLPSQGTGSVHIPRLPSRGTGSVRIPRLPSRSTGSGRSGRAKHGSHLPVRQNAFLGGIRIHGGFWFLFFPCSSLVPSQQLRPFLPDRKLPSEQEYGVVCVREPQAFVRQWSDGARLGQELHFSSTVYCHLVDYRNLTLFPLLQPFSLEGHATNTYTQSQHARTQLALNCSVFMEAVQVSVGQHAIHTLDTALQAWKQNLNPAAEEVLFSHYVICNDTQETLRFGQVDTDESVLLASGQSHQYCWRSHKSPQLLHICIEGWGNWRWSEPFSIDNVGALLRSIQRKGQTATLIIKVQQLSGVQKQIIICGRQVMCSYLSEPIEVRLVQHCGGVEGQTETRKLQACVEPHGKLPSYVLEDCEVTELCVRACGDEDWSQDVHLERGDESNSRVLQVPSSSGSLVSVWCTVITLEPNSHMQQRVVVFSPLFVMRNHLPEAVLVQVEKRSLGQKETQLISGQGQHQALLNVEPDITHHLTFQASEEEDASHCAVPISSSLIKQIANKVGQEEKPNHSNILEHFYGPKSSNQQSWPYTCRDTDRAEVESLAQWDSPMQVRLCAWRPGLSTLLVELLPWALLSNRSHWDLWLFEGESIVLQIPAGKTIVPPNFKEALQIGLYWPHTNTVHKSAAVRLLHELTSPRWKEVGGAEVLSLDEEGYVEADIILGAPPRQKLCQFCVSSTVRYGIQVLQIEDKTAMVNNTPHTIHYRALLSEHALAAPDQLYRPPADTSTFTLAPVGEAGGPSSCAVPCWAVLGEGPVAQLDTLLSHKHILLSCLAGPKQEGEMWSQPVAVQPDFPRQSVCVPVHQSAPNTLSTRALVVTYQEHLGIGYISVNEDPCPRMLIHNHCPMALLLKENIREPARTEVFCRKLPPLSSVNHELYHHSSSFPDCRQREALPTLMLCAIPDLPKNSATSEWTEAIDINNPGTQVMFLPSFGCLYIEVTHEGGTIILTFAPESSAGTDISQAQRVPGQMLSFRVLLSEVSVALCDDITSPAGSVELLRLTLSKLLVLLPPPRSSAGAAPTSLVQQVQVLCGSLQVDNQLYNRSSFHFPVLLCQEQRASTGCWLGDIDPVMNPEVLEEFQRACFLCVGLTLFSDRYCLEQVSFCLKPARIYLEDTFVYYLKTLFHTYLPISTKPPPREQGGSEGPGQTLPLPVYQSMQALVRPVRLQRLLIEPVSLLVSIHASLKLYIASDHTPLSFSVFERGPVCTTPRQLIHALTMHYAAGALFRAGWVVGSLEILGSPASLVRSIGNGVADLFRLPYEGLTRGPGAFVSGVSRGTSSFVRHISKGTLTSITNLATSLARNMDRLSLDEEHYTRQEEWRRQLPESLGHGLRQGLSRLGISLLGAIAGIVDQPMQTFTRPVEAHYTAGSTAKGIISGVGKGIVGVFTKPIGGAAELVSQTGYGILHGAGLWQLPKQLYLPTEKKSADAPNSQLKYV
ncbi:hypothetical protein P4O66_005249 [Electrophorus voltai]|uniref:Vacuolar protein sorting 13 homolog B n=1 Tax=Electrophorus voltai TaxID=2609070 RepID=A0AAD9E713_9TELE|nr:hypothetical protein P4O66_005249 [Electrophorus voltai]